MSLAQALLAEFEHEAKTTRKFLERIPEDKLTWKPHPKSMTAGQLALHTAAAPGNVLELCNQDPAAPPDFNKPMPQPKSLREVLEAHDKSVSAVKAGLPKFDEKRLQSTWRAVKDGQEILAMPRAAFLRSIMLNHWYHHRGQLGVYLRLLGAKVPASYGPSGDEMPEFMKPQPVGAH